MSSQDDTATAELADLFLHLGKQIRHRSVSGLAPHGLTPAQFRALRIISHADAHGEPLRIVTLAAKLDIVPRSATAVVDALETLGLAARADDPADRRSVRVVPTDAARELLGRMRDSRRQASEDVFAVLSGPDRADLARLLGILHQALADDAC